MVRVLDKLSPQQARPVAVLILCALASSTVAIVFGALGAFTYSENTQSVAGLTLQHLRPLHTTFATAWIYLAACTVVYFYLFSQTPGPTRAFRWRLKGQILLWAVAGTGVIVTLCRGVFSGREYMGAHWVWSIFIYLGWILFAWNFYSVVGISLKGKPVFIYMWYTAFPLFMYAFAEGHGWLLAIVGDYPLRDIAIQWKSYGPLVGSFNLLVYGSLGYIACCLAGDSRYAYSNTAFCLFFVGVLNSFTNFGHHTYHLPQSHVVKWISCIMSLAECVLVFKYLLDLLHLIRKRSGPSDKTVWQKGTGSEPTMAHATAGGDPRGACPPLPHGVGFIVRMTTVWSLLLVGIAVTISVPSVNTLIHGTHFVMAHAMGSMLGIDSMILWAALLYIIQRMVSSQHRLVRSRSMVPAFAVLNLAIFLLFTLLAVKGLLSGYLRYMGPAAPAPPAWLALFPTAFMALGVCLAIVILYINLHWAAAVFPLLRREPAPRPAPATEQPVLERQTSL